MWGEGPAAKGRTQMQQKIMAIVKPRSKISGNLKLCGHWDQQEIKPFSIISRLGFPPE